MKRIILSANAFFRALRGCLREAWQGTDCHYHIPKSRFKDDPGEKVAAGPSISWWNAAPKNYFLGSFRDCLLTAWETAEKEYHLPKSRLMDSEFKGTTNKVVSKPDFVTSVERFFYTLRSCISMAWEVSETFYYLPKSRYQNADFIRELMKLAPEPPGKLLIRPYTFGHGVVVGEAAGKGWNVPVPDKLYKNVFIAPEMVPGEEYKPEVGK